MDDFQNAFIDMFALEPTGQGELDGLSFALKDLIDVEGRVAGCGNPTWAQSHPPATAHAPVLEALLKAGGRCLGKTHTDELAYSLMGLNAHYGAPTNPAAPDRAPGGSSSGSAVAVAAKQVDFAVGTDTGGSVRLPASFCGIYGLRPTHGAIDMTGVAPLAPSFDTVGWFARAPLVLAQVGRALGLPEAQERPIALAAPSDLWALADAETCDALRPALAALEKRIDKADRSPLRAEGADYSDFREVFRIVQAHEAWAAHGAWVSTHAPDFGPGVKERFAFAQTVTQDAAEQAILAREQIRSALLSALPPWRILALPTSPAPAPRLRDDEAALDRFRSRALALLSLAGLSEAPQLSIPAGFVDGAPVGLSLLGAPSAEQTLIEIAIDLDLDLNG